MPSAANGAARPPAADYLGNACQSMTVQVELLPMTYNFDPDKWYEMEYRALTRQRESGRMGEAAFEKALSELQQRYEQMLDRLDGTYRLPGTKKP